MTFGKKYIVVRADGTLPEWPYFVLGAKDPAASSTLRAYASTALGINGDEVYHANVKELSQRFGAWSAADERGAAAPESVNKDNVYTAVIGLFSSLSYEDQRALIGGLKDVMDRG
jgi:hypothetical protein